MRIRLVMASVVCAACAGLPVEAGAQAADAAFFRGRTVTYIVSTAPGGGYDAYGRLLVRFMEKHLPGSRFVVRNVPGAGQIIGANTIYVARADGLTLGTFNTGLLYSQMLGFEGVRFDLGRMSWVGKMADEGRTLMLANNSGLDSVEDLITARETVRLASAGVGSASYIETRILREMLGLNVRLITGILGADTELSMLRGEVAGALNAASSHDDFVRRGDGRYVLSIAGARSHLPGVPQARDYVSDPQHLRLLSLVETMAELGRLTAGPPGIPPGRLEALRDAYMKAVNDPELRSQARQLNIPIEPARGEEVARKIAAILDQPPDVIAVLRQAAQGE